MTRPSVDEAVALLLQARRTGHSVAAPQLPDADAAYTVQASVAQALGWFSHDGRQAPRHWKSGGPSRDIALTHAPLPPAGVWQSPAVADHHSDVWPLRLRGLEAEVALRLGRDVDAALAATLDRAGAAALVDAMCVSIEVVESRWAETFDAPPLARLADLQSHGALVLGNWVPFEAAHEWAAQTCRVRVGAAPEAVYRGSHPLADPCFVLPAWLRHATRNGAVLVAGSVVSTGSWCGLLFAQAGDTVHVSFDGIGTAQVTL